MQLAVLTEGDIRFYCFLGEAFAAAICLLVGVHILRDELWKKTHSCLVVGCMLVFAGLLLCLLSWRNSHGPEGGVLGVAFCLLGPGLLLALGAFLSLGLTVARSMRRRAELLELEQTLKAEIARR